MTAPEPTPELLAKRRRRANESRARIKARAGLTYREQIRAGLVPNPNHPSTKPRPKAPAGGRWQVTLDLDDPKPS